MKATVEIIKKYENMIHSTLRKNKFNLLQNDEYEDLLQQGRLLIIEGLEKKYDPSRGSISTFLYMFLDSRLGALNSKRRDVYGSRNVNKHIDITSENGDIKENFQKVNLDNILFHRGDLKNGADQIELKVKLNKVYAKLSDNRRVILKDYFIEELSTGEISKKLGKGWSSNRVNLEVKKITRIFLDLV